MKLANRPKIGMVLATGIFTLLLAAPAWSQNEEAAKAHALLDKVKKTDLDRQIAARQTEIDRLKQDDEKARADAQTLQKTMDSTTDLVAESADGLNKLTTENKKLEHELAVNQALINAERQKIDGLRALGAAQTKSLNALNRRLEEVDARSKVRNEEMAMLTDGRTVPGEGREEKAQNELARWRKALSLAESKTQSEERIAHDAMKGAANKLALADASAARAQHLAEVDPLAQPIAPIAEKTTKGKAAPVKSSEKPADGSAPEAPAHKPVPANATRGASTEPVSAPVGAKPAFGAAPKAAPVNVKATPAGTRSAAFATPR